VQMELLNKVSVLLKSSTKKLAKLEEVTAEANDHGHAKEKAEAFRDEVFPAQNDLRADIDQLEMLLPADLWPVPTYAEMLFNL
jgi:glutamine synthetase